MHKPQCQLLIAFAIGTFVPDTLLASADTIGPNGINSAGLGLTGEGIAIGQVDVGRPGEFGYDTDAMCCNDKIVPTEVFVLDMDADMNEAVSGGHAMWVAGVMISKQTMVPPPPGDHSPPVGVAQEAALYASGFVDPASLDVQQGNAAIAAQHLATLSTADVKAINMSFGLELESGEALDGGSLLTEFMDWSASAFQHDVLYVVAGNQSGTEPPGGPVPTDNFNGLTVAMSTNNDDGVFRNVSPTNDFDQEVDAVGDRTSTDILAPGVLIDLAGPDGTLAPVVESIGTSFAAPHVTGTVALLQQHAVNRMGNTGWDADSRRHEVMKAVLMNSADKLIDDGTVVLPGDTEPLPLGSLLGMQRTVLQLGDDTWFDTFASTNEDTPLDERMGAGHLNASRAFTQFDAGESVPGELADQSANVPVIGWDYNANPFDDMNKYVIQGNLIQGSFISVTLA